MEPDRSLAQWVALSLVPNLGRRSMVRLIEQCGSLDAVFGADEAALRAVPRIGPKLATA
ncbi:MAG: DNA-protecting protein DprA, partial [Chloroflexi bacterium]